MSLDRLAAQLQEFVAAHYEEPVAARNLHNMEDSHAGLTFGFDVFRGTEFLEAFVMRMAPAGVRLKGNTDVYRQAPLLRALHAAGQPVPVVRWASQDPRWFGVPFIVMEKLPGRTLIIWQPAPEFDRGAAWVNGLWRQAAAALAELHRFDWRRHLADWEAPVAVPDEIRKWDRILAQAPLPEWVAQGQEVRDLLLSRPPPPSPVGLFHGDYQPGNVLYRDGELVAIVDWELAGIGAQLIDIGWLMMMGDPTSWHTDWQPLHPPPGAELRAIYESALGRVMPGIPWYQALSGYRFGVISCLNVKLHRRGQRHDPVWEKFASSIPFLFGRARALLQDYA